jgi:lipid-A-disaccharide synthase-like uncharacterized protein
MTFRQWDLWVAVGIIGQCCFAGRFIVQWIFSEYRKASIVPVSFWYLSLLGGTIVLIYAIHRRDPVFILGQAPGLLVYIRNLMLIRNQRTLSTP